MPNISNEDFLDSLPNEVLGIIFDQVVNQSQSSPDIYSILLTCQKWKHVIEEHPCISLVQALFQLKFSHRAAIKIPQECIITKHKQHFTCQEFKLINRVHSDKRFEKLLMIKSELFQVNSVFLSLLDRYPWDFEVCKKSANKNIQHIAEKQSSILSSLISGTDEERLTIIKNDFIEKFYHGGRGRIWQTAERFLISTLKKFTPFNDNALFIKVARCFGHAVFDIDESLKKDREIVLAALQQNGMNFQFADESLKKDREIALAAINQDAWALQFADESLKKDRDIVLAAVQQYGQALRYADGSLKKDRDIVLAAVNQDSVALQYADDRLKKDQEIVLAAVQQNGMNLQFADESLKKDREIVLVAVKQNGLALLYANESLKKDREVVLFAVKQYGWALIFADESLKKDREIVLAAVQEYGWSLLFADSSFKKDREIVLAAVKENDRVLLFADEIVKKDQEIIFAPL